MLLSNGAACGKKISTFVKNKDLNNFDKFKTNKSINKFSLTGNKFMLELHLKKAGFTYSACGPFPK